MSSLSIGSIKKSLKTDWLGRDLQVLRTTSSTNSDAESLGRKGGKHGLIVLADSQTRGRGRFQRVWFSPPDVNLYFSMLLFPEKSSFKIPEITLVAAVSLHEAIKSVVPSEEIGIKWPNDILCNGKKVAGILSEFHQLSGSRPFVVVGIGLNVNSRQFPDDLQNIATSLAIEGGEDLPREDLFSSICYRFEKWYEEWDFSGLESITSYWIKNSGMMGKSVKAQGNKGIVLGLSDSGALLMKDISGAIIEVNSGEIEVVGD